MKFTITRSRWLRGGNAMGKLLRPEDGKQCCFGQIATQCGLSDDRLRGKYRLDDLCLDEVESASLRPFQRIEDDNGEDGAVRDHEWVSTCYGINDNRLIGDDVREQKLIEAFAANGHELIFID
jgi:hypothetical protein